MTIWRFLHAQPLLDTLSDWIDCPTFNWNQFKTLIKEEKNILNFFFSLDTQKNFSPTQIEKEKPMWTCDKLWLDFRLMRMSYVWFYERIFCFDSHERGNFFMLDDMHDPDVSVDIQRWWEFDAMNAVYVGLDYEVLVTYLKLRENSLMRSFKLYDIHVRHVCMLWWRLGKTLENFYYENKSWVRTWKILSIIKWGHFHKKK